MGDSHRRSREMSTFLAISLLILLGPVVVAGFIWPEAWEFVGGILDVLGAFRRFRSSEAVADRDTPTGIPN
jgi:hypothetical protein